MGSDPAVCVIKNGGQPCLIASLDGVRNAEHHLDDDAGRCRASAHACATLLTCMICLGFPPEGVEIPSAVGKE